MDSLTFEPGANNVDKKLFNEGLHERRKIMGKSNEITLIGRLTADFFLQNRYLLDNTDLTIKI